MSPAHRTAALALFLSALASLTACGPQSQQQGGGAPGPVPSGLSPSTGPAAGGTAVLLGGASFQAGATVTFGGAAAAVGTVTPSAITLTAPAHAAGAVDVVVTNPDGQQATLPGAFTYLAPASTGIAPIITAVSPTAGLVTGGTQVTITGQDFDAPEVRFDGLVATVLSAGATQLVVSTPAHASGPVAVTVVNADGLSASRDSGFRYVPLPVLPAPTIAAASPASGPAAGNASVVVTGTGFAGGATVTFGGVAAVVTAEAPGELAVLTPPGLPGAVDVVVTNVDRQSATLAGGYTYLAPPPVVTAVGRRGSPQDGGGLQLFVGSGLQDTVGVTFGGVPASGLTYDAAFGNLTATIPPSPLGPAADGFVDIVLVNRDGQSTTWPGFHYGNPPAPSSFTPTSAPRDAEVVITGVDFTADATGPRAGLTVSFSGTPAVVVARSATQITVLVPKMNPGTYQVAVVNFDGQLGVAPGVFIAPGP